LLLLLINATTKRAALATDKTARVLSDHSLLRHMSTMPSGAKKTSPRTTTKVCWCHGTGPATAAVDEAGIGDTDGNVVIVMGVGALTSSAGIGIDFAPHSGHLGASANVAPQ
jgi:hypothetical protein